MYNFSSLFLSIAYFQAGYIPLMFLYSSSTHSLRSIPWVPAGAPGSVEGWRRLWGPLQQWFSTRAQFVPLLLPVLWGGECSWHLEGRGPDTGNHPAVLTTGSSTKSVHNTNAKKPCSRVNLGTGSRETWGPHAEPAKWWVGAPRTVLPPVFLLLLWDRGSTLSLDGKPQLGLCCYFRS